MNMKLIVKEKELIIRSDKSIDAKKAKNILYNSLGCFKKEKKIGNLKLKKLKAFKKEEENTDLIILKYKIEKNKTNKILLFSTIFIRNNIDNCKITFGGNEFKLMPFVYIDNSTPENRLLEVKIKIIKEIKYYDLMFYGCTALYSFRYISKLNNN
jgi:hypothetical protein